MSEPCQPLADASKADLELMACYFYLERMGSGIEGDAMGDWDAAVEYLVSAEAAAPQVDSKLGIVYPERPEDSDPLTRIKGLDADDESYLNERGIYRLAQIASWTPRISAALEEVAARVERENWIGQARALVIGQQVPA